MIDIPGASLVFFEVGLRSAGFIAEAINWGNQVPFIPYGTFKLKGLQLTVSLFSFLQVS